MKFIKFSLLILVMIATLSCRMQNKNPWPTSDAIAISWEVMSNTYAEQARVKAAFTLENNSDLVLTDQNWALYFNMSPRLILDSGEKSGARIEHISGDWHRIVPQEGFRLNPGEKLSLVYEARYWWIKETDAPKGLYFVFSDEQGDETIVEVSNYTLLPFEREEQLSRHFRDQESVPSPGFLFEQNSNLQLLEKEELLPVIPSPFSFQPTGKKISPNTQWRIVYNETLSSEATLLAEQLSELWGLNLPLSESSLAGKHTIRLQLGNVEVDGKRTETYRLEIGEDNGISITGNDRAGVFYGIQSLLALSEPAARLASGGLPELPIGVMEDAPRFGWRGVHLDVARNFQSKETVLKLLDILSFYKINVLHLHLTDDEGWRLEIAALPQLTSVGAHRGHTSKEAPALHPSFGSGPFADASDNRGSGYYSQEDFMEILRYAQQRHIRVIPEINMPGHARAAIKAMEARYNYYMERGEVAAADEFRLIDPEDTSEYLSAQLFSDNVVNVARESVYHFFATVLDEVINLYAQAGVPLEMVHVGGDEVPAGSWTASPMINQKMAELSHITRPANMHAYFTHRTLEIFQSRGLRMAGWEEVALKETDAGKHQPNTAFADGQVVPFVWNNLWGAQDLAYRLANRGFPVVLCHVTAFYFDLAYNKDPREPGLYWGGFVNTRSAWHYSPFDVFSTTLKDNMGVAIDPLTAYRNMERLDPPARQNILGVQAQLWSETIKGPEMLEYYLLPKLIGFAQTAWARERNWETISDPAQRNTQVEQQWNRFANTLAQRELPRLSYLYGGFQYRLPPPGVKIENAMLHANTEFPGLIIRYTLDGTEPDLSSPVFTEPIPVNPKSVKLKAFDLAGRGSRIIELTNNNN